MFVSWSFFPNRMSDSQETEPLIPVFQGISIQFKKKKKTLSKQRKKKVQQKPS